MKPVAVETFARLRALAEQGMREDAPEANANAREDLLAIYLHCYTLTHRLHPTLNEPEVTYGDGLRQRMQRMRETRAMVWDEEDLLGFEWIDRLAENGHAGARQLRRRVIANPAALSAVFVRNPERAAALAEDVAAACIEMARYELAKAAPDLNVLYHWLQSLHKCVELEADREDEEVQGALRLRDVVREMRDIASTSDACDVEFLTTLLAPRELIRNLYLSSDPTDSLARLALLKLSRPEEEIRVGGERLLRRAADLGSVEAQDAVLAHSSDPKTVCRWLPAERAPTVAEVVDLLQEAAGEPSAADLEIIRATRFNREAGAGAVARHGREPYAGRLLYTLARLRLDATEDAGKDAGWKLLEHAAERGSRRAQVELYRRTPDKEALARRIEAGGEPDVAAELRELVAITGQPGPADLEILEASVLDERVPGAGQLLHALAQPRLASKVESARALGKRWLNRAAQLGSLEAKTAVVMAAFEDAGDRRAFVRSFLRQYPNSGPIGERLCLRLGCMVEKGELGGAPDLPEAADWYTKGLGKALNPAGEARVAESEFCYAVATAFDRRWRLHRVDDPAIALAWHARGLSAGNVECFNAWIGACLNGELGLRQDPVEALAQVRRFKAVAGHALKNTLWGLRTAFLYRAGKAAETDAALGARWQEIAAELGAGDADSRIG